MFNPNQRLREMILSGERVTETRLAKRLEISRTPNRNAQTAEGFLEPKFQYAF